MTIAYLSPIFTTILGVFLLGERVRRVQWLFYAIAFSGVHVSILNYTGLIYALAFGVFIFGEVYPVQTLAGIRLVAAGVVLSVIFGTPKPLEVMRKASWRSDGVTRENTRTAAPIAALKSPRTRRVRGSCDSGPRENTSRSSRCKRRAVAAARTRARYRD